MKGLVAGVVVWQWGSLGRCDQELVDLLVLDEDGGG